MYTKPLTHLALASFIGISAMHCSEKKQAIKVVRPVRYETIIAVGGSKSRSFSGSTKAALEVNLSFKVGGTIQTLDIKVGDKVKKGEVLAALDKRDNRLRYEQAKVAVSQARVQMQTAKSAFERTATLYQNNNVSLQDFEQVKSVYESSRASLKTAQRGEQLALRQLEYTALKAPIDGIVTRLNVEKNENVNPGQSIAELNSGKGIEVTIGIPEAYISKISQGEKVSVRIPALESQKFQGTVSEIAYSVSKKLSTYPVCIILEKPTDKVRPGMAADVAFEFESGDSDEKIIIPLNAVTEDLEGRYVFRVSENDSGLANVHKTSVKTGELTDAGLVVLEGLKPGDKVVTAGLSKLSDKMVVKLLEP